MTILVGMPNQGMPGGIWSSEKALTDEYCKNNALSVVKFQFGRRSPQERIPSRIFTLASDVIQFGYLLLKHRPTIVQLNSSFDKRALLRDVWYVAVAATMRKRLFMKYHGSDLVFLTTSSWFWTKLRLFIQYWSAGIGVLSTEEEGAFSKANTRAVFVVKNAVDCERFRQGTVEKPNVHTLLFIGRFIPSKGLQDAIEAVSMIRQSGRKVHLVCVGDGPQRLKEEEHVHQLGIAEDVTFTGYLPEQDTTPYYLGAHVLLFPSFHQEGFPMAVFQAAAAGLPIVATRTRALADYLEEPLNCLWAEPKHPTMLAEKIVQLLDDELLQMVMRKNNIALAERFSPERVAAEYLALYRRLAGCNS